MNIHYAPPSRAPYKPAPQPRLSRPVQPTFDAILRIPDWAIDEERDDIRPSWWERLGARWQWSIVAFSFGASLATAILMLVM